MYIDRFYIHNWVFRVGIRYFALPQNYYIRLLFIFCYSWYKIKVCEILSLLKNINYTFWVSRTICWISNKSITKLATVIVAGAVMV